MPVTLASCLGLTSSDRITSWITLFLLSNVRSWKSEMLRRPHALMTASLISISGITRLSSMSMHPYLSGIGMSTHAVSSVSVYLRMTDSVMHTWRYARGSAWCNMRRCGRCRFLFACLLRQPLWVRKRLDKLPVVLRGFKDVLTIDAAYHNVVDSCGTLVSCCAWHSK